MRRLRLILITAALATVGALQAETKISATSSDYQAGIGDGWDTKKEKLLGRCLVGKPVSQGHSIATAKFEQSISFEQLESELGFGAQGRARFGVVSVSAAASFLSNSKSDAFSIASTYQANYKFKNLSLTNPKKSPEMKDLDDLKWDAACGDEYVAQLTLGAKIFFTVRIDFQSNEEKRAFEAQVSAEAPLWSAAAQLKTASKSFSKRTKVSINTLQIGGEVDKLSGIFGNEKNLITCSIGEFDKCKEVLESALKYATQEFPKQISKETLTAQLGQGPVVIEYLTKPYATAGVFPKSAPEVIEEVKRARFKLNQWLTQFHAQWIFANRYTSMNSRRLSDRQRDKIQDVKMVLDENLRGIAETAQHCYDKPDMTCVTEMLKLNPQGEKELKPIDKTAFVIENETFAQYCDDGNSPNQMASQDLKKSVAAYIALAKELRQEAFIPPVEGAAIDECYLAGAVLGAQRHLNISKKGISDIRPLMEFVKLESLDLSDNEIRSLEAFDLPFVESYGGFKALTELNLHNNLVSKIASLVRIPNLEVLNVSNNRLEQADELKELKRLEHVDLRNNSQDLKLELPAPAVVLTADHGSSAILAAIERESETYRYGHASLPLPNGDVLITGGIFGAGAGKGAELFDLSLGVFSRLPGMGAARQWQTMTQLKDGKILIAGGEDNPTGEVFDPRLYAFRMVGGDMSQPRFGHTASLLADGKVLLAGGFRGRDFAQATLSAEIYDPTTERFTPLERGLSVPRAAYTATTLQDGRVLLLGGLNDLGTTNSADVYDPTTGIVSPLGRRMQYKRSFHSATLLSNGKVLIIGGIDDKNAHPSAEMFDPKTNTFRLLRSKLKFPRMGHQATLLSNGIVAVTGGSKTSESITLERTCRNCVEEVELYDPATEDFSISNNSLNYPRIFHSVSKIRDNQYLLVGGLGGRAGTTAEILSYSSPNK